MAKRDKPGKVDAPPNVQRGAGLLGVRKLIAGMAGSRLCFGEPVRSGERVVIPVARVHARGGFGHGEDAARRGEMGSGGAGGGGTLDAAPVGFIEIAPEGARFEGIPDPMSTARALRTGATALTTLAGALVGAAALRRRRRAGRALSAGPRRLLRR